MPLQRTPKICTECGSTQHYGKGLCRPCYGRAWKTAHAAEVKAYQRAWYLGHQETQRAAALARARAKAPEMAAYNRARYYEHLAECRAKAVAYQAKQRTLNRAEYVAKKRAYNESHREQTLLAVKRRYDRNPTPFKERAHLRRVLAPKEALDWDAVYARDRGICHICEKPVTRQRMSLDHVVPISRNGSHTFENVRTAHLRCNIRRQNRGPGQPYLL